MNETLKHPFRSMLFSVLKRFSIGRLEMTLPNGEKHTFGDSENPDAPVPAAAIQVHDTDFFRCCVLHGNVGMGEAFINGLWETPDIRAVIEWFAINIAADERARRSSQRLPMIGFLRFIDKIGHWNRGNSKSGSRRNIEEHYDLGNDFYQLWLDGSMTYSSARFSEESETLETAQANKYEALCEKLQLTKDDHVLEIGCGWGGFSIHAASTRGCRVTGVTISPAQHAEAVKRVTEAGLEDLIDLRLQDYRDIEGTFDKIVSIEMLEAVGDKYLETWCKKVHEVLAPNGLVAVQMITVPDNDHRDLKRGTDFIQKHIFPGSLLLSVGRMNQALNKTGDLFLHGMEDLGTCYSRTLRHWFENFNAQREKVMALGFDERFIRKWNYYLKYCEAGFSARTISVVQGVYTRPNNTTELSHEDGVASPACAPR